MSDANRTALRYVREVTFGTTPNNPAFQEILVRSSSLKYNPQTIMDDQIRSDEQVQDQTLVGYDVQGDLQARLTYGALDDLMESALFGAWSNRTNAYPTAVTGGTHYTVASGGASFTANDLILASGFSTTGNNGLHTVTSSTSTNVVCSGLTAEASPPTGARIRIVGKVFASGDAVAAGTAKTITLTSGTWTSLGLVAGAWVKVGGSAAGDKFATTANNGYARVSSVSSTVLTFDVVPSGWADDAGTGKTLKVWVGDVLRNGTTNSHYTFEREYSTDTIGTVYEYFRGIRIGKFNMKLSPRSNIEASFEMMGLNASDVVATRGADASGGASTIGTPTSVAAVTSDLMNTSSNVAQLRVNGAVLSGATAVTEFTLDSDRALRMREGIGTAAAIDIRRGRANVTCSCTAYFETTELINLIRNDERSSADFVLQDVDGVTGFTHSYLIDIPRVKASEGAINVEGVDTDITIPMKFQGIRHETLGYTLQVQRFHYVE